MRDLPTRSYPEIDGIRGVLSVLVVLGHITGTLPWPLQYDDGDSPMFWYWGCMEVFFCISGFLITRGLLASMSSRPDWISHYLKKRALRIWPAYYVALAFALLVSMYCVLDSSPEPLEWNGDLHYLLKTALFLQYTEYYVADRLSPGMIPTFGHSWSVALEEQFYLLILLALLARKTLGIFPGLRILIPLVALLPLSQVARHAGFNGWTLLGRLDGFLFGIALAFLEPHLIRLGALRVSAKRLLTWTSMVAPLLLLLPYLATHGRWADIPLLFRLGPFNPYVAFGAVAFGLIASIILFPETRIHSLLRTRVLRHLGAISYSTYLFHVPALIVMKSLLDAGGAAPAWLYPSGLLVVFLLSNFTYRYIEVPFLRLKDRMTETSVTAAATRSARAI